MDLRIVAIKNWFLTISYSSRYTVPQDNPKINEPIKDLKIKFLESEYRIDDL